MPFALYRNGNKIELLANNRSKGDLNIINWEFNLADFSVVKQDAIVGTLAVGENSYCDFLYDVNEQSGYGGISFVERKGKKAKECAIHSLSWDANMKKVFQQSTDMDMLYGDDLLSKIKTAASGETWTLLDIRDKNYSTGTAVYYMGDKKSKLTRLSKDSKVVSGASLALDPSKKGVVIAGFIAGNGAAVYDELLLAHLDEKGIFGPRAEHKIPGDFINQTTKLDKKTSGADGLSKYYYVREVRVRDNGMIDVVASFIRLDVFLATDGPYTKTRIGDLQIYSFEGDKMVSAININRNIEDKQRGEYAQVVIKDFSIPFVYTHKDELVILTLANTSSFAGHANPNLEDQYIGNAHLMAVKIDKQFKQSKQVIYDFTERRKYFDQLTGIFMRKISKGQFFGYTETEWQLTSKAKLVFSYIKMK